MKILRDFPIILTKDSKWVCDVDIISGAIVRLPEDAVLVIPHRGTMEPTNHLICGTCGNYVQKQYLKEHENMHEKEDE